MSEGTWLHQIEIRFLIDGDVLPPPPPDFKARQRAFLLPRSTLSRLLLHSVRWANVRQRAGVLRYGLSTRTSHGHTV
jgi:hypothetical protein